MPTNPSYPTSYEFLNSLAKTIAYVLIAGAIAGLLIAHIPGLVDRPWSFCVEGGNRLYCNLIVHLLEAPFLLFSIYVAWQLLINFEYKNRVRNYYLIVTLSIVNFTYFGYEIGTALIGVRRGAPTYETVLLTIVALLLLGGSILGIYLVFKMTKFTFHNPSIAHNIPGGPELDADGFYHPEKEEQIQAIVRYAAKHNLKVRVRGSTHSVSWAIYTDPGNTPNMVTEENPPGGKNINIFLNKMNKFEWVDKSTGVAIIQAGIHLGIDPEDPTELNHFNRYKNSLLIQADNYGWTLSDLGGITHQTLGGFLSTGSSGGCLQRSIEDNFLAFKIIDGYGNMAWVEKDKDEDLFNASGVSMGLLGIIVAVRIQFIPKFNIIGNEIVVPVDPAKRKIACKLDILGEDSCLQSMSEFLKAEYYTRVLWYPQKGLEALRIWSAKPVSPEEVPFKDGKPRPYREFTRERFTTYLEEIGAALLFTIAGNRGFLKTWAKLGISFEAFRSELYQLWKKKIGSVLSGLFSVLLTIIIVLISFVIVLILSLFRKLYDWLFPKLLKILQSNTTQKDLDSGTYDFHDYMWRSLPMDNGASDIMMGIEFTEIWIPMKHCDDAMRLLNRFYEEKGSIATGYSMTELYAGKASKFWLSPSHGDKNSHVWNSNVLRIDLFWYKANDGNPSERGAFYDQFWRLFRDNNIPYRLHWAKFLPEYDHKQWAAYFRSHYERWDEFMEIRKKRDPHNVFLSNYWRDHLGISTRKELPAPDRALVISGGGARGAWGVGVAKGLSCDKNNHYQLVVGTSTGSLMGPLALVRDFATLKNQYLSITQKQIFNVNPFKKNGNIRPLVFIWRLITGKKTVGETANLRKKIKQVFTQEQFDTIQTNRLEFTATVTSLTTSRPGFKSTQDYGYEDMVDWAWASANTPVFMSNVHKEGEVWVDGGLRSFIPIAYAMDREAKYIDVIVHDNQNFGSVDWSQKDGFFNLLLRVLAIYYTGTAVANVEDLGLEDRVAKCDHHLTFYFMNQRELDEVGNDLVMDPTVMAKIFDVGYNDVINDKITKKTAFIKKGRHLGTIKFD